MQIIISARELMDKGLWEEACDELGLNLWAVNEGRMDSEDEVTLTEEQAARIGLIRSSKWAY